MQRALLILLVMVAGTVPQTSEARRYQDDQGFFSRVTRISPRLADRMDGISWHEGCPVAIKDLRLVRVSFHDFDGERRIGKLVVHKDATEAIVHVFGVMWDNSFKIAKMHLVDRYDGNDRRSMRADNTSAFNCRYVAGTTTWSQHAYGTAIDINPVENPYVDGDYVSPKKGAPYADRNQHSPGMIHADGKVVEAFTAAGWGWGGHWSSAKDYQHFSATGG